MGKISYLVYLIHIISLHTLIYLLRASSLPTQTIRNLVLLGAVGITFAVAMLNLATTRSRELHWVLDEQVISDRIEVARDGVSIVTSIFGNHTALLLDGKPCLRTVMPCHAAPSPNASLTC